MDKIQLIKMLNWNISVDSEIEIDKVLDKLRVFFSKPEGLIKDLETLKAKGIKKVDKSDIIMKLERL